MRALAIAALVALSACGSKEEVSHGANAATPVAAGPHLGDIPLDQPIRATDNALTWSLEVAPGEINFTRFAGQGGEGSVTEFYPISPVVSDDKAVWTTRDSVGTAVVITLSKAACSENGDPSIDRPLTAELRIGDKLLRGCAGSRPADGLDTQPDNGNDANLADNVAVNAQ